MKLWATVSLLLAVHAMGCALIPDESVVDTRFTCGSRIRADMMCRIQRAGRLLRHARVYQEVADFLEEVSGLPVGCVRALVPYASTVNGRSAIEQSMKFWETSAMYRPSGLALQVGRQLVEAAEPFDSVLADSVLTAVRERVSDQALRPAADFVGFHSYGPTVSLTLYGDGMTPSFLAAMVRDFVASGDTVKFYAAAAGCDSLLNKGAFRHGMANAAGMSGTASMLLDCARAFASVRRMREALSTAYAALAVDPLGHNELPVRVFLGWMLDMQLGEKAGAEQQYALAFDGSPDHCVSSINIGWLYVDSGLLAEAVSVLSAAHERARAGRSAPELLNASLPAAGSNSEAAAAAESPASRFVQLAGSLAPAPDKLGTRCGGAYTEKLYWNLGQATLEQRTLARVQEGRAWLRRPLCLSLASELGASEAELCRAVELGIAALLDAIAAAREAAARLSDGSLTAPAGFAAQGSAPAAQQAVDAAIRSVTAAAAPTFNAEAQVVAADRSNEPQLRVNGSYGLSIVDFMAAHRHRRSLQPEVTARRRAAFAWLVERRPSSAWLLLHSAFATPQIMPLAGRDVRLWRRWALEAMLDLEEASSVPSAETIPAAAGLVRVSASAGVSTAASSSSSSSVSGLVGCVRLERFQEALPDMPFAWQYHGFDDDAPLQTLFSQLLACNYNTRTPPALEVSVLAPRAAQLRAWRASKPALTPAQAAVFAAGLQPLQQAALTAPLPRGPAPMRTTGDLSNLPFPFASPLRVGFMSKYFTLNHPHSQLLTGVLRRLDRSRFTPLLLRIINTDRGYFVDPAIEDALVCPVEEARRVAATRAAAASLSAAAAPTSSAGARYSDLAAAAALSLSGACDLDKDERRRRLDAAAFNIPHNITAAHELLVSLKLDVLVSADHVSEGVTQVLGFMRQAAAQGQYWGNPITTGKSRRFGSGNVDYYLSGELLEMLPEDDDGVAAAATAAAAAQPRAHVHVPARGRDFYSERVVLLPGSGIHYERITMPPPQSLCKCSRYGLPEPPGCPALQRHLHSIDAADSDTTASGAAQVDTMPLPDETADPYPVIEPNMRYIDALRPLALLRREAAAAAAQVAVKEINASSEAASSRGAAGGITASAIAPARVLSSSAEVPAPASFASRSELGSASQVVRISSAGIVDAIKLNARDVAAIDAGKGADGSAAAGSTHSEETPQVTRTATTSEAAPARKASRPIVFGCPQSLYKLRPEFDAALAAVLRAVPDARLLMVTERREMHTRQYQQRIRTSMLSPQCASIARSCAADKALTDLTAAGSGANGTVSPHSSTGKGSSSSNSGGGSGVGLSYGFRIDGSGQSESARPRGAGYPACPSGVMPASCLDELDSVLSRITWVGRQSGNDNYFALLSCADVLLHPFPFDGSKTAADGIAVALPMVTLPTNHLRGRMGYALYRSIGVHEALVAHNESHYVDIAVRLATDPGFRADAVAALRQRRYSAFDQPHSYGMNGWQTASSVSSAADSPLLASAEANEGVGVSADQVTGWESFFVQAVVEQVNAWEASKRGQI